MFNGDEFQKCRPTSREGNVDDEHHNHHCNALGREGMASRPDRARRNQATAAERLAELPLDRPTESSQVKHAFVASMDNSPIALVPDKANEQHYEVSAGFFAEVLGPNRKYSACYWADEVLTLGRSPIWAMKSRRC